MTTITLRKLFEIARDNACKLFLENGYKVSPLWHVVMNNNEHTLIVTPWANAEQKEAAIEGLRALFKANNVEMFAFICEAWTVQLAPSAPTDGPIPLPSEHPDRREVLRIVAESRDESLSGSFYILRPEHSPPTLSPFHEDDFPIQSGRLAGMLTGEHDA